MTEAMKNKLIASGWGAYFDQNMSPLSDRDAACLVARDRDYDEQLAAIDKVLRLHLEKQKQASLAIDSLMHSADNSTQIYPGGAADEYLDRMHESVFVDAAHSMSAVGMLAPFFESYFFRVFHGIRELKELPPLSDTTHARWLRPAEDQWDCHYVWRGGRRSQDLVGGIFQLAEATELASYLDPRLRKTLQALFNYRNRMFHHGLEWPESVREKFGKQIEVQQWGPNWFVASHVETTPWIYYLTDPFTRHCVVMAESAMASVGKFCKEKFFTTVELGDSAS